MEEKDEMLDEFEYSAEAAERKTEVKMSVKSHTQRYGPCCGYWG